MFALSVGRLTVIELRLFLAGLAEVFDPFGGQARTGAAGLGELAGGAWRDTKAGVDVLT